MAKILTLPESSSAPLSIRAKALVFHDPASQTLLTHVERLACRDVTVLITGETGTGKELIARHIHAVSERRGPFVAVNCGAFSETLIDAELFGHESGAFTGASQARAGWFEAANGGTLFLDEIGDLPLSLQVKLLRVLQERQVVRLGSRKPVPLDVRLVAATNIDLARAVEAQHFRADLYYRLSVATVRLPALCERQADILPLAEHFVGVYSQRLGLSHVTLSPGARDALQAYGWPGNIRELENVIHYALIVCRDGWVRRDDLKLVPLLARAAAAAAASSRPPDAGGLGAGGWGRLNDRAAGGSSADWGPRRVLEEDDPDAALPQRGGAGVSEQASSVERLPALFQSLLAKGEANLYEQVEDALIRTAFEHCSQNQVRTARALGLTRNMLRTHLKRRGLLGDPGGDSAEGGGPAEDLAESLVD